VRGQKERTTQQIHTPSRYHNGANGARALAVSHTQNIETQKALARKYKSKSQYSSEGWLPGGCTTCKRIWVVRCLSQRVESQKLLLISLTTKILSVSPCSRLTACGCASPQMMKSTLSPAHTAALYFIAWTERVAGCWDTRTA
jgi:hypothetical protein